VTGGWAYFNYDFMGPVLSIALLKFDLTQTEIGYFFMISAMTYIIGSLGVPFIPSRISKRSQMIFGIFALFFSMVLMGPSQILHIPENLAVMGVGQALCGFFLPFCLIPCLPEMVDIVERKYSHLDEKRRA